MIIFQALGGQAVVENSSIGLHRNVSFLHQVSTVTGIHVVAGTGMFKNIWCPADTAHYINCMNNKNTQDIATSQYINIQYLSNK
jgi:phosphotriesterase-related protein